MHCTCTARFWARIGEAAARAINFRRAMDGQRDRARAVTCIALIETYSRELPIVLLLHLFQFVRLTQSACFISWNSQILNARNPGPSTGTIIVRLEKTGTRWSFCMPNFFFVVIVAKLGKCMLRVQINML